MSSFSIWDLTPCWIWKEKFTKFFWKIPKWKYWKYAQKLQKNMLIFPLDITLTNNFEMVLKTQIQICSLMHKLSRNWAHKNIHDKKFSESQQKWCILYNNNLLAKYSRWINVAYNIDMNICERRSFRLRPGFIECKNGDRLPRADILIYKTNTRSPC